MTFPIPKAGLDDKLGWTGITGSGKTYNASTAVEALLALQRRVITIDPLGVWWGLRKKADGKSPAFDVAIFGGKHGDLPLNEHAGALVGEAVATTSQSCIIDLSDFNTKAAERRFMLAFLEAMYRKANGEPVHVIFDEADLWAPQKGSGETADLQSKMEQLVRRGRVKGHIPWLITQRPAVLSKDVLSQMDGLIMFKLTSPHDRDAIGTWVQGQADQEEWKRYWANMATLDRGQGLIWIPARGILKMEQFPEKETYDSSKTPKRGEKQRRIELQPIDLGALKEKLATVEKEVKANDPKALKQEIAKLKAELAKKPQVIEKEASMEAVTQAFDNGYRQGFDAGIDEGLQRLPFLLEKTKEAVTAVGQVESWLKGEKKKPAKVLSKTQSTGFPKAAAQVNQIPRKTNGGTDVMLTSSQQRIADALLFWESIGQPDPTREQVAAVAGFRLGGHFSNLLGSMRSAGIIEYPASGRVKRRMNVGVPITTEEAAQRLQSILSGPQLKVVNAIQGTMSRDELSERAGLAGGHYSNTLGSLRTIDVVRYPSSGMVELSDWAEGLL